MNYPVRKRCVLAPRVPRLGASRTMNNDVGRLPQGAADTCAAAHPSASPLISFIGRNAARPYVKFRGARTRKAMTNSEAGKPEGFLPTLNKAVWQRLWRHCLPEGRRPPLASAVSPRRIARRPPQWTTGDQLNRTEGVWYNNGCQLGKRSCAGTCGLVCAAASQKQCFPPHSGVAHTEQ